MINNLPHRRELKFQAKKFMLHPTCVRVTLLLVCMQIAFFGLRYLFNGTLSYALVNLADYANTATGIYFNDEGFSIIFRMDLTQMVLAIPLTYTQLRTFVLLTVVIFALLSPLRVGAMEQYWQVLQGGQTNVRAVFQWFAQARRFGKALVVEFVLQGVVRLVAIAATIPSLYLFYQFYTNTPTMESYTDVSAMTQMGASVLAVAAALFAFWLHSVLLPVRYCLAAHPEYSLGETFRRGAQSLKGFRGAFFRFRLTYVPWFFVSQLTYGALDLYVTPYTSLGGMRFLQEAARVRQGRSQSQPEDEQRLNP